ncbi:DNA polymerase III subunit epsilon [Solibacillus sp. R5-41]|uniref:BRCT domain-containing protein n=1 Tax=Solibacillus sp. R5-41 TaxID=2048654 RepID=UPI000C126A72|nr:BRCT domain-containing protein [Solibacillus sp. R5-41]ATP42265.1 DNA polymerase III subunit epsilon [Solibacillus sp. R5-41]
MHKNNNNSEVIYLKESYESLRHPFYNKQLVFTGALSTMTRSEAAKRVRLCGGFLQGAVTTETDFVIIGNKRRGISAKQQKAEKLIHLGFDLQFLVEDDFLWLLSMEKG